jgi:hypothetical protein
MVIGASRQRSFSPFSSAIPYGLLLMLIGLWASGCTPLIRPPTPVAEPAAESAEARLIVQVHYPTVEMLNALASELDVWEVDRAGQSFVARVTLAQYESLLQQEELQVTLDCAKMRQYEEGRSLAVPTVAQLMQDECP